MLNATTGTWPRRASFAMPVAIERVSECSGVSPRALLDEHTLFPYVVAFTSSEHYRRLRLAVLTPGVDRHCLSVLLQPIRGAPRSRRFCPACLKEDSDRYGEGYWHRAHLLPGVEICVHHGIALCATEVPFQRTAGDCRLLMPGDLPSKRIASVLSHEVRAAIASISASALWRPFEHTGSLARYREQALHLGYRLSDAGLSGSAIARDLSQFFGSDLLDQCGCRVDLHKRNPWPALLVRPDSPTAHSPVKHILMMTFLEHAPSVRHLKMSEHAPKGKKPRDYSVLDDYAFSRMTRFLERTRRNGKRYTVRHLLKVSELDAAYRRHRDWFPKTRNLIYTFRLGPRSFKRLDILDGPPVMSRKRHSRPSRNREMPRM
jgi:TniQ/Tn7-like transposition protein D